MRVNKIGRKHLAVLTALLGLSVQANAMSADSSRVYEQEIEGKHPVTFAISTGVLNGESKEYVHTDHFGGNDKISELTWDLKNIFMVGGETSLGLTKRISLNLGGWINANDGSGDMTDYDWRNGDDEPWTDYTLHDAEVEKALLLDANMDILLISKENCTLSGVIGFRHDKLKWDAYNGKGIYSTSFNPGDRAQDVEFDGSKDISYKQELYSPYLGLDYNYSKNKWTIRSHARASLWAWGDAEDIHHRPAGNYVLNKDITLPNGTVVPKGTSMYDPGSDPETSIDEVEDMLYMSFGIGVDYQFAESFTAGLSADFQEYKREEEENKDIVGGSGFWGGMSHMSYIVTASARYLF